MEFIALVLVLVLAYQVRRLRRELAWTRAELDTLGRRLERLRSDVAAFEMEVPEQSADGTIDVEVGPVTLESAA